MTLPDDWWQQIKEHYPKRQGSQGWHGSPFTRAITARLSEGSTWNQMIEGTKTYKLHCDHTKITGTPYVMQAKTFFGPSKHYLEDYSIPEPKQRQPQEVTKEDREQDLENYRKQMKKFGVDVDE